MIRRPPRSTLDRSSAASDVYKRQELVLATSATVEGDATAYYIADNIGHLPISVTRLAQGLSLIHISEPTRPY